jgi:uncharacterized protein YpmS
MFEPIQRGIIKKFNSDPNITNLDRILRLPNYLHLKDPDDPFLIKCIKFDPQLCYIQEKLAITLGCDLSNLKNNENSRRFVVVDNKVKLRNDIVPLNNSIDIYIYTRTTDAKGI